MQLRDLFTADRMWRARNQIGGVILLGLGLVTTAILAGAASSEEPPSVAQSALFVVISGIFNALGVWLYARRPGAALLEASKIAFRHLGEASVLLASAREEAEAARELKSAVDSRRAMGILSVRLSAIEERLGSNLEDWVDAHPDLSPTNSPRSPENPHDK